MAALTSSLRKVSVTIVSDIVWPWCYVGLRHLEAASQGTGVDVQLTWEPFFLNPNMHEEGQDLMTHLGEKYGDAVIKRFKSDQKWW